MESLKLKRQEKKTEQKERKKLGMEVELNPLRDECDS